MLIDLLLVDGQVRALRRDGCCAPIYQQAYQILPEVLRSPRSGDPVILPLHPANDLTDQLVLDELL